MCRILFQLDLLVQFRLKRRVRPLAHFFAQRVCAVPKITLATLRMSIIVFLVCSVCSKSWTRTVDEEMKLYAIPSGFADSHSTSVSI